jgi:multidrug efflux pump subunit AcrA (membrane-fusion protein)
VARKILAGLLIVLSVIFLVLSVAGIGAIWFYRGPLTREAIRQLKEIDAQLAQAEATLQSSEKELQRALRIVDSAEAALEKLAQQTGSTNGPFDNIQSTIDDQLLPDLKTTRQRIDSARKTLESLQSVLQSIKSISSFIPGLDLNVPAKTVTDLIASTHSLDNDITNVEALATQASTFVSDTSFLLGGDFSETRTSLTNFVAYIQEYEKKVAGWRAQEKDLLEKTPQWINQAAIILTIFLVWFGLSQFGLLLHGLSLRRGEDPFYVLKRKRVSLVEENEEII